MQSGWGKISQISKYSGLSEKTLRSLLKQGLRHSRLRSGTILIKLQWVDEFLEKHEVSDVDETLNNIVNEIESGFK